MVKSPSQHQAGGDLNCGCELCAAHKNFSYLLRTLGTLYGVTLDCPRFESLSGMKGLLADALLPGSTHPWVRPLRRLKLSQRLSILGSLFLFRKTLPSQTPSVSDYAKKMSEPSPPPPPDFIRFIRKEISEMFPCGWDRGYAKSVEGATLSTSSCREQSKKKGGCRSFASSIDRNEFCGRLMELYGPLRPKVDEVRLAVAPCDGKKRLITINSKEMSYLMPLHHTLYGFISKEKWCLRGEANANRFREFNEVDGEVFVSGDYESATDNLNQGVQTSILRFVLDRCKFVPLGIRRSALDSLSCRVSGEGFEPFRALRGQMMGNALSFPLLCLVNYLTFRYYVRRDVPVRINGDDIVFRARPDEYARWKDGVQSCGLTLSPGKTVVARRWFSLNSTFFVSNKNKVKMAPVVRSTVFFKKLDDPSSLEGRFDSLKYFDGRRRSLLTAKLLGRLGPSVRYTQRSLRRGLGIYASDAALLMSKFAYRERFYLSLPAPADPPLPVTKVGYYPSTIPEGWVRKVGKKDDPEFAHALVEEAWKPKSESKTLRGLRDGTFAETSFPLRKMMKMTGFRSIRRYRSWAIKEIPKVPKKERMVWARERPLAREGHTLQFVSAGSKKF